MTGILLAGGKARRVSEGDPTQIWLQDFGYDTELGARGRERTAPCPRAHCTGNAVPPSTIQAPTVGNHSSRTSSVSGGGGSLQTFILTGSGLMAREVRDGVRVRLRKKRGAELGEVSKTGPNVKPGEKPGTK